MSIALEDFSKKLQTSYCIDLDTRDRQVVEGIHRIKGRLQAVADHDGHIAVVCYGPSLEQTWEQLRNFNKIITCSGAHKFIIDRGIIPTWHCEVDPRPHKAELIGTPHKDVEYLVASVCHQQVFDLLEGYNVKLWHVFSHESNRQIPIAFPRGEWCITGGSNIGLRAMVLARFLGFKQMTVFGMDFSFKNDGTQHAGWHPKEIPVVHAVQVEDQIFYTNTPMHQYAQEFFNEITKLGDIKLEVVGNGLLQALIKERMKSGPLIQNTETALIAATLPQIITPEYLELNKRLHADNPDYGTSGSKRAETVRKLVASTKPATVLDYGCGKGTLAMSLAFPIWEYDPAIPGKDAPPRPADLVIATDVLEHIEPECLDSVLLDLARCTLKVCYAVINTGPAIKTLADGRNTHLIQQPLDWWKERLSSYFSVATMNQEGVEITAILGPKPKQEKKVSVPPLDFSQRITPIRYKGTEVKFHTPNAQTNWRAQSLPTKEPATMEWIDTFKEGEVFWDVGANVGGYSVWASKRRGVKVVAFEPQAENYAMLCRNLTLNQVNGTAYCLALTDKPKLSQLWLSSPEVGSACHTFDESVGYDLKERKSEPQGCVGYTLDMIAKQLGYPDHIKIDVDGLEHLVLAGGEKTIAHAKSFLVEVNQNLKEHQDMVHYLGMRGFAFDPKQVEQSTRKEGTFKGCAEYVFRYVDVSLTKVTQYVSAELDPLPWLYAGDVFDLNVTIQLEPFPWFYAEDVFQPEIFSEMRSKFPTEWTPLEKSRNVKGYPERYTANPTDPFWKNLFEKLLAGSFKHSLCGLFEVKNTKKLHDECLLIRDVAGYKIGPHTDSPRKVITVLFYLPPDESMIHAGTSIYEPLEPGFRCPGGPHYEFDKFKKIKTMPFKPNSAFAFLKTDNSFHGVEPCDGIRDVLLYDIYRK